MKQPFQAVAVRYVHDVLTGEFLNIGVVLLCAEMGFVSARFITQWTRVSATFPSVDLPLLRRIAIAIEAACAQARPSLGQLILPSAGDQHDVRAFVNRIVPPDDAGIQLSHVLRGVTDDPDRTLHELHHRYTQRYVPDEGGRALRTEADIWFDFASKLAPRLNVNQSLGEKRLTAASGFFYQFDRAWKNGVWNIAQPVSFDLREARTIRDKAALWTGRVVALKPSQQNARVMFIVGVPPEDVRKELVSAASDAICILRENLAGEAEVIPEMQSDDLADRIVRDLAQSHG